MKPNLFHRVVTILVAGTIMTNSTYGVIPADISRPGLRSSGVTPLFTSQALAQRSVFNWFSSVREGYMLRLILAAAIMPGVWARPGISIAMDSRGPPETLMQEGTKRQINVWTHSTKRILRFLGTHPALALFVIEDLGTGTRSMVGDERPFSQAIMEGILPMVAFLLLLRLLVIIYAAIPDSEYFLQMPLLIAFGFVLILIGQAEFVAHHDNKTRRQLTARIIGTFLRGAAILMGYGLVYYTDGRFFGGQHKPLATAVIVLGGSVLQIMSGGLAHSGWNAFWRWRRKEQYLLNQGRKESNVPAGQAASDVDRRTEKAA